MQTDEEVHNSYRLVYLTTINHKRSHEQHVTGPNERPSVNTKTINRMHRTISECGPNTAITTQRSNASVMNTVSGIFGHNHHATLQCVCDEYSLGNLWSSGSVGSGSISSESSEPVSLSSASPEAPSAASSMSAIMIMSASSMSPSSASPSSSSFHHDHH